MKRVYTVRLTKDEAELLEKYRHKHRPNETLEEVLGYAVAVGIADMRQELEEEEDTPDWRRG